MAVLGSPISHSLSPAIHQLAYRTLGVAAEYQRFEVDELGLADFLEAHRTDEWRGFSLTMPLKEIGCKFAPTMDFEASQTRAINTLVAREGAWHGINTDISGFRFLLTGLAPRSVSILGVGGTARAALAALPKSVGNIEVFRRRDYKDDLLREICPKVKFREWSALEDAFTSELLINATPAGALDAFQENFRPVPTIIDSIYSPWPPPLMKGIAEQYFSGKDLLVAQALEQIAIFTGKAFEKDEMFQVLRNEI